MNASAATRPVSLTDRRGWLTVELMSAGSFVDDRRHDRCNTRDIKDCEVVYHPDVVDADGNVDLRRASRALRGEMSEVSPNEFVLVVRGDSDVFERFPADGLVLTTSLAWWATDALHSFAAVEAYLTSSRA
jgi:hypothetical protein